MAGKNAPSSGDQNPLFLVDGSGFIFRAYYALPPMTRSDGTPVNAVLGFTNMLVKLIVDMDVHDIGVIFDAARENFRNEIYPEYKANRSETPEDLIPQFPLIRQASEAFGLPPIEKEGYEADDLIATYARMAREAGREVVIVSSDKDLMQLVREGVRMFDPIKSRYIDAAEVEEKFNVAPEKVVDVQALAGDSTDNVPGVPGIGIKTAAQLINEYGDLETLLARAEEIKQPKRRETLINAAEAARISKKLVQLDANVDVPFSIDELRSHNLNPPELINFLKTQEFRTTLARLEKVFDGHAQRRAAAGNTAEDDAAASESAYELVQDIERLKYWIKRAEEEGIVAIDTETTSLTPAKAKLVGISLAVSEGGGCYIPVGHVDPAAVSGSFDFDGENEDKNEEKKDLKQLPYKDVIEELKPLLEDASVLKIGQNIKYDLQMFLAEGIHAAPVDDTMLLSYVLDGTEHGHGMDELAELFLGETTTKYKDLCGTGKKQITFDQVPLDKACDYAAEDADLTLRLYNIFKPRLAPEKRTSVYEILERPLAPVIAQMEWTGVRVDPAVLKNLSRIFAEKLGVLEEEIHKLAGMPFNIGSPKQLGEVLFDNMGFAGGKKTKSGTWSTGVDVLERLAAEGHVIAEKTLEWRQMSKLKSTYTDALVEDINPKTGRIHTSFSMALTNTGRLSSSDPNLQNIPIRTEDGRKIREAFIADDGHLLLSVDYSQVELRLAAELAGIKALQDAFANDLDIHSMTASQVFDVPMEEMTPEIRRRAKAINFGIIYGISGFGLGRQLGIPTSEAAGYIEKYLARFPELPEFMEKAKEEARAHGYVTTFYGRKCVIHGINDKNGARRNFAERQAVNAPLQGTAADIMKRAMVRMPPALEKAKLGARMLLQVHDELLFEVPEKEMDETISVVTEVMQNAAPGISIPLKVESGYAKNWSDAH
ncbi:MAG: DNA polymerase I [Micavibrio sp.]|nr:MAG: DNA polymerase I [Micavibrio sp.]